MYGIMRPCHNRKVVKQMTQGNPKWEIDPDQVRNEGDEHDPLDYTKDEGGEPTDQLPDTDNRKE